MPNQLRTTGNGIILQVTKPPQSASVAEEDSDSDTTHRGMAHESSTREMATARRVV